ncbi:DUF3566 domain-containing protein [Actinomadura luteofluorescens]|uniref:DUF3566 domain-containing protein n=1 Tax=Actinomadura luteofluorescens TaxID=46163 RepID=UPI003628A08E
MAAASAKSGRDETTVDIDTGATDPAGKADETRSDLTQIDDAPAKAASTPEIAPVKDTAEPPKPAARRLRSAARQAPRPVPHQVLRAAPARRAGPNPPSRPVRSRQDVRTVPARGSIRRAGPPATRPARPARPGRVVAASPHRPQGPSVHRGGPGRAASKPAPGKPARKAQLQLSRLEPWSVMKFSFVMSLVCFVVLLVAVIVLYVILSGLGVFDAISDTVNSLTKEQGETTGGVDAGSWFSFVRVFGYTVLVGALNVLLITALSTVGSVIYNLAADLVGGVEVTLKEAE